MRTYSFDILDTCLCRTCGEPYAVFDLLARNVMGADITPPQLADFRLIRTKGEINARRNSASEDITIEQIYQECDFSGLTELTNDRIIEREIQIERTVLRPIYDTLQRVKKIHSQGKCIVYISDMYLPSTFFVELLKEFGFWKEGDKIFVSCEIGKSKVTGNLFRYVANELDISFWRWTHYGDNRHSDVNVPRRLGIFAHQVKFGYSHYQNYLKGKDFEPSECYMARLAGISRSIGIGNKYSPRLQFAADIIAPIYVSFTYNVLNDAFKRGITRLFFIARDAHIIYCIAKEMASFFPSIEIKYLYASRKALYLPSLDDVTIDSLRTILPPYKVRDDERFDNFQVDTDGMTSDDFQNNRVPLSVLDKIKKRWIEQKRNTIDYFIQEGLADNYSKVGIVDIRGTRKCQRCINRILRENDYKEVYGYYLELDTNRIISQKAGEYTAYMFHDYHLGPNYKNVSLNNILLEKYFCISSSKRTCGYVREETGRIIPEFEEGESLPKEFDSIHQLNVSVCTEFLRLFFDNKLAIYSKEIFNYSFSLISEFANRPQREYVKVLKDIEYNETSYHGQKIIGKTGSFLMDRKSYKWFRGSLLFTSPIFLFLYDFQTSMKKYIKSLYI